MTLTTHAIVGAAAASLMPEHPVLGFCAGLASHYVIDAIPHWDYPIYSDSIDPDRGGAMRFNKALMRDMVDIGFDIAVGVVLALFLFATPAAFAAVLAGAIGGILPDPLQFVYTRWKHEPILSIQKFHEWVHTDRRLREEGHSFIGIASQIALVAVVIFATRLF